MGQTQAQLSRLENGPPLRDIERLAAWATLLDMPPELLWFALPTRVRARSLPSAVDGSAPIRLFQFMQSMRQADRQVGGSPLYATVTASLGNHLATRQSLTKENGSASATAALHEMAGWMAHDGGMSGLARKHFTTALPLAERGDDQQLTAQIRASFSHLMGHLGKADDALEHSSRGLKQLRNGPAHGPLTARLLALEARAFAASGRPYESAASLDRAEQAWQAGGTGSSQWLSPFDFVSLAVEVARCHIHIGDLPRAEQYLRDALAQMGCDRTRSRALATLMLITTLIGQNRLDEAADRTRAVLEAITGLSSAVVVEQLRHVAVLLSARAATFAEIPPLLTLIGQAIRQREWIGTFGPPPVATPHG